MVKITVKELGDLLDKAPLASRKYIMPYWIKAPTQEPDAIINIPQELLEYKTPHAPKFIPKTEADKIFQQMRKLPKDSEERAALFREWQKVQGFKPEPEGSSPFKRKGGVSGTIGQRIDDVVHIRCFEEGNKFGGWDRCELTTAEGEMWATPEDAGIQFIKLNPHRVYNMKSNDEMLIMDIQPMTVFLMENAIVDERMPKSLDYATQEGKEALKVIKKYRDILTQMKKRKYEEL